MVSIKKCGQNIDAAIRKRSTVEATFSALLDIEISEESIDFKKSKIILVETHKKEINAVVNSAVHQFMEAEGYSLFNWVGLTAFYHRVDFAI